MPGKKGMKQKPLLQGQIEWAINETKSASAASRLLGVAYNTFKKNGSKFLKLKSAGRNYNHNSCAGPALVYSKVFFDKKR